MAKNLYNEKIEALIEAALTDGILTDKEREILIKKASEEGIDKDEFEMVLDSRVKELNKKAIQKEAISKRQRKDIHSPLHGFLRFFFKWGSCLLLSVVAIIIEKHFWGWWVVLTGFISVVIIWFVFIKWEEIVEYFEDY